MGWVKFPFYESSNRTTALSAAAIQLCCVMRKKHNMEKFEFLRKESFKTNEVGTKKSECKFCYSEHESFTQMVAHIQLRHKADIHRIGDKVINTDLVHPCKICAFQFISGDILAYHIKKIHMSSIPQIKTKSMHATEECNHCSKNFTYYRSQRKH